MGQQSATQAPSAAAGLESKSASSQAPDAQPQQPFFLEYDLTPSATDPWTDTGIDLLAGDLVRIMAEPPKPSPVQVQARQKSKDQLSMVCNPEGVKPADGETRDLPVAGALPGALIAKLATGRATPFLVGREVEAKAVEPGHLYLGVNTDGEDVCESVFRVKVRITPAQFPAASAPAANPQSLVQVLDDQLKQMIDRLPRRVTDGSGRPGDVVNFIFIGSAPQVQRALAAADWVIADRDGKAAALHALMKAVSQQDYLEMPMSKLYLFGRAQDYGYEQSEAYKVIAARHHFRIWKAPWETRGLVVWLGAGTHDIGFEKDQRNGGVTHKIDPQVDAERDYIAQTLRQSGMVRSATYLMPSRPLQEGHNATGGKFRSDGRILVIPLQ